MPQVIGGRRDRHDTAGTADGWGSELDQLVPTSAGDAVIERLTPPGAGAGSGGAMSGTTTATVTGEPRDEGRVVVEVDLADLQAIAGGLAVLIEHHLDPPSPLREPDRLAEFDARGAARDARDALARLARRYPGPGPTPEQAALRAGLAREMDLWAREREADEARRARRRGWREVPPGGRD